MRPILLASTSVYRAELLQKMGLPFCTQRPPYDEDAAKKKLLEDKQPPLKVAESLSKGKAHSITNREQTIIAGDQLVHFKGAILGKSHSFPNALQQLKMLSGNSHELITSVTILSGNKEFHLNHITSMKMKVLTDLEISNYLKKDEPYDCAGSYKIEKSGIILFDEIKTDDFSAIQGLPMIWISQKLKELGYEFFGH